MSTHDLKSWPANFTALLNGRLFEVRRGDRAFALGDFVHAQEYLPVEQTFTGRTLDFRIDDVAPFCLPGEAPGSFLILHYQRVRTIIATIETAPPVPRSERPLLELWAKVVDSNRVMQIVEDERGENHQVFGSGIDPTARVGSAGRFRLYHGGLKTFSAIACVHDFSGMGLICQTCSLPLSMAGL